MDGLTQDGLPEAGAQRTDWKRGRESGQDRETNGLFSADTPVDAEVERIAWLSRTIEVEIIPRLMLAHQEVGGQAAHEVAGRVPQLGSEQVAEFTGLVLTGETAECITYVERFRAHGVVMEAIHLELLAPAARRLGSLWEEDLIDFTEVTVGLWRLQQVLREFSPMFRGEGSVRGCGRRALFGAIPGEQHTLGILIVTEFFRTAGWDVWDEPSTSTDALTSIVGREWFDLAGLSAGCDSRVDVMTAAIRAIRTASANPSICVIVGGPLFIRNPELAGTVGADGCAQDAKQAVWRAEQLVARLEKYG